MDRALATGDYEIDRQRHVRAFVERLPSEVEKLTWPLEKLHALRDERLRALVRIAKERSPWHAQRLNHIDPDRLRGDELSAIPPMTKTDLMNHWDEIVTDRRLNLELANRHLARISEEGPAYLLDDYHAITSGGSSGMRGVFVVDFEAWLATSLAILRHGVWIDQHLQRRGEQREASIGAGHVTHASIAAFRTFASRSQSPARSFPITSPFPEILAGLNEFQPSHIVAYPSIMHRLALEQQAGRLSIAPESITCIAEPLQTDSRQIIAHVFGIPPMNMYGCSECGPVALSYPGSPGMHLVEDTAIYEPVDAHGRPVPPGVSGAKLLVTNVLNQALPLIRYELTDEVTFLDEPNPDPWTGRRIADVKGRLDDHFVYPGDVDVAPLIFWTVFGTVPEIFEYQVQQTLRGVNILVRYTHQIDLEPISRSVKAALARLGLAEPEVSIKAVDHIERHAATGKLRRFVPMSHQAYDVRRP